LKRITATEALKHDWMAIGETELSTHQVDVNKLKAIMDAKKKMRAAVTTVSCQKVGRLDIPR
jgi:hypothetical protein